MESFILKIFFAGLIAFTPSDDGKELTVLLLNTRHGFMMADGSALPHHRALLLARAGDCTGRCGADEGVATYLYGDKAPALAGDALRNAMGKGAAWQLSRSELSIGGNPQDPLRLTEPSRQRNGSPVPKDAKEREHFKWVADLSEIVGSGGGFKPELFARRPSDIVAARLRLRSGKVFTYSVISTRGKARPIPFRNPDGKGADSPYRQALAGWVQAEIRINGAEVEITGENFDNRAKRSMTLKPEKGVIEMAIVNIPPVEVPKSKDARPPEPGQHFQIYYDLLKSPPEKSARLVPFPPPDRAEPAVDWGLLHPTKELWSDLLEQLRMGTGGRSMYDLVLCPMARE